MTLKSLQQYGKGFQLKVLGSLLTDKSFLLNVRDVLHDHYFDADSHKWIVKQICDYFDRYHTNITMDVLKVELQKVENEVLQVALKEPIDSFTEGRNKSLQASGVTVYSLQDDCFDNNLIIVTEIRSLIVTILFLLYYQKPLRRKNSGNLMI